MLFHKKGIFIFSLLIVSVSGFGQQTRRRFQADYDVKPMRFGYFIGITKTNLNLKFNHYYTNVDKDLRAITSPPSYGLKMGGLMNFRLNDYYDFRILPTVAIQSRNLEYELTNGNIQTASRESAWLEFPAMLKYKSERRGNVRMYVFGGLRYSLETNAINRMTKRNFITKTNDFSIEYGTGLEFFREYFKFAPEIHFSHGMSNLNNNALSTGTKLEGIDKMRTHNITLFFIFE